jgi:hypothetical protein
MTKNQQLWLGVGVVGVAGYFYWKSKQPNGKAANSSEMGRSRKNIFWLKYFSIHFPQR